jgi:hypothetical protein
MKVALFSIMFVFVFGILSALLMALPVMYLWNVNLPDMFPGTVPEIGFWRAWGLAFLCRILFASQTNTRKEEN